jgi:integrase
MDRPRRLPSYRRHKPSGLAVVTLAGRDIYLGKYGTPASRAEYDRVLAEYLAGGRGRAAAGDPSVAALILAYYQHALSYYVDADGAATSEVGCILEAIRPLRRLYGHTLARDFGPLALKAVRVAMVELGWARTTVNGAVGRIRRLFRWAIANELAPPSVYHGLQAVTGLRAGRTTAREPEPVRPVPEEHVRAVLPLLTPPLRAMVEVQALCGARPGEIVQIRGEDLDRTGPVWTFTPARHKTKAQGKRRTIALGPKAQAILLPWLKADLAAYVFSPAESMAALQAEHRAGRPAKPKRTAARRRGRGRRAKPLPTRAPGAAYTVDTYRRAIARACERAGVPAWTPHRLRHSVATRIRAEFGLESAQHVLGHAKASTTEIYAEASLAKAAAAMRELG